MLATFDLPSVQRFADNLVDLRVSCNGEGTFCSATDEMMSCHSKVCETLLETVYQWRREVFSGNIQYDSRVENLFLEQIRQVLIYCRPLFSFGDNEEEECYEFQHLDELNSNIQKVQSLLDNWVTPQRSVRPAPRVDIGSDAANEIRANLEKLASTNR